eukprot:GHVQ01023176.1.p1 GENE.GHVQ01023176.1~~GHVQ01023176.1.p1  ORF type:complete len:246 (+),score=39.68 GHVQ01023176.1:502-1239(+)
MSGDRVMAEAVSSELPNYGVKVGLTNYPAAYCTGLLVARRLLKSVGMEKTITGVKETDGEEYHVEEAMGEDVERRPFKCLLDVGIVRTSRGNRVFGAMKGAVDGGLHVPHDVKCFPGYSKEEGGEGKYDASAHRDRIFGKHIAGYMKQMLEDTPDKYEMHFSQFVKAGINADALEEMYKKAHAKIRATPDKVAKPKKTYEVVNLRQGNVIKTAKTEYTRMHKLTLEQRKARVARKMQIAAEKMQA